MRARLLRIDDCPGWESAAASLREALDAVGHGEVEVEVVRITRAEQAAAVPFAGSPTIVIDDADLFSGARTDVLACRVYPTALGLRPAPTTQQITDALLALGASAHG